MNLDLTKKDLWILIRGLTPPSYDWINKLETMGFGSYVGGFADKWNYNPVWQVPDMSEEELWGIYLEMKTDSDHLWERVLGRI